MATPALAQTPPVDDPGRFFLFHADAVSVDEARADLRFCIEQARPIQSHIGEGVAIITGGGLIGGLIGARIDEVHSLRMRNAAMRKCMGLLGYGRFAVPKEQWQVMVNRGDIIVGNNGKVDSVVVERMAVFAAGPQPAGAALPR